MSTIMSGEAAAAVGGAGECGAGGAGGGSGDGDDDDKSLVNNTGDKLQFLPDDVSECHWLRVLDILPG